jgi:sporulation protein YlmC with PRC-barrel domain
MPHYLTIGALVLTAGVVVSGAARADCDIMIKDYDAQLAESPEYRAQLTSAVQRDVRQLRDAAYILQHYGKDDVCEEVVASIQDMIENPEDTAQQSGTYDDWTAGEMERIKNAKPVTEMVGQLRAEQMIGADVRNMENEDIGEIEDVVLAKEGGASYVVLSHGGFLGLGEKQVAVPFEQLKVAGEYDVYYVDMTEELIETAPSFERGSRDWLGDEEWRQQNDEYYSKS